MIKCIHRAIFITAATVFLRNTECKSQAATFDIQYSGFDTESQTAFEFATGIWSNFLISDVPVKIEVNLVFLLPGQLGITFPNGEINFPGAPVANVWYASCLANAISGTELNPGEADMNIFLNSNANWYFGTDGNPGPGEYDFVSTCLHEIGHGLGFLSLANMDGTEGSFGIIDASEFSPLITSFPWPELDTLPGIFDTFLEAEDGTPLLSFPNPSDTLGYFFTTDVYFNGPNVLEDNGDRGIIYTPSTYTLGSSMTHWDEASYPVGNENELMTPSAAAAHANYDPGPLTLAALDDIGWEINYDTADIAIKNIDSPALDIYPNPGSDFVFIRGLAISSNYNFEILNEEGKEILAGNYNDNSGINIAEFSHGIYFLKLFDNENYYSLRFIK